MKTLSTKRALLASVISLLLCVTMLVGSTFAWFTDTATASVNTIKAGTLDVALNMMDNEGNWVPAEGKTLQFLVNGEIPPEGTEILWEPGCTYSLPKLQIVNGGDLALKYKVVLTGIKGDAELNDVIEWTIDGVELGATKSLGVKETAEFTISGHMQETAGNTYMGKTISGITISVIATQDNAEYDSNGNAYDENADFPVVATTTITVDTATGKTTEEKSFTSTDKVTGTETPVVKVTVPADVKLVDGKTQLTLAVSEAAEPDGFTIGADEFAKTYEIKIAEVAEDNTEKITVELHVGTGLLNPVVYHNGVEMDAADYTYDAATGIMTIKTATFSPFTVVSKAAALVNGVPYTSLDAAMAAAEKGATVTLNQDYTGNLFMNGMDITFDFAGYTVNGILYIGCINDGFTSARDASTVILKDSVGNGGVTSSSSLTIIAKNGSKITIDGGNYVCEYAKSGSSGYSSVLKMTNCELTINGGYLHNNAQVGNYNKVINVDNDGKDAKVTINGGKLEGTQKYGWSGSYSYIISSDTTGDTFPVEINGGEFISHTSYSYLTRVYGNVVINDCTFVSEGWSQVFDITTNNYTTAIEGISVTVRGGTYTIAEGSNAHLAGFAYCNKNTSNAYGYAKGSLVLDPTSEIKINTTTHATILSDCGVVATLGSDGYYTITKAE